MTQKLLILDLDETLIHSREFPLHRQSDFQPGPYFSYKRPFLAEFIETVQQHFDLAVWTSAGDKYAEWIVQEIFPDPSILLFVWSSDRCTKRFVENAGTYSSPEYVWIKNLKKVKRFRPLSHVIMVDDSPEKLQKNYGNLVRIRPYQGEEDDIELKLLAEYLPTLEGDIRTIDKRGWRDWAVRKEES